MSDKQDEQSVAHDDRLPPGCVLGTGEPVKFTFKSLWGPAVLNPLNHKSCTIPALNLRSPHARNFHLAWLGFLVAFLSWFAFPPLFPEAIKADLKLTKSQIGNSNIVGLASTLGFRLIAGTLVDRYGPRKVMAVTLFLGAIPSGLAGTATSVGHLYAIRFFIGLLGATVVPCVAWTTTFFDKSVVGTANAFAGGWGNLGGGVTFIVMVSLYDRLRHSGLSQHNAWRVAFAAVPVPILLFVGTLTLVFGTDCPAGKWSQRHTLRATAVAVAKGHELVVDSDEHEVLKKTAVDEEKRTGAVVTIEEVVHDKEKAQQIITEQDEKLYQSEVDVAVNERLTLKSAKAILLNPLTWLPGLSYITSFGFELAIDANISHVIFDIYKSPTFGQTKAGYIASTYGLLNLWTRPSGGIISDLIYPRYGVAGKKYWMLFLGVAGGIVSIALGTYINKGMEDGGKPSLAVVMVLIVLLAITTEQGCGANFSLVPHCNPYSNGVMSGIVAAMGNVGGVIFAMIFRFEPLPLGKAFWICGIICIGVNLSLVMVRVPKK